jgi:hypothetical protein
VTRKIEECVWQSMKCFVFEECVWQTVFCFFRGKHDITHSQQCLRVHLHILVAKETIHTPLKQKSIQPLLNYGLLHLRFLTKPI